MLMTRHFDYCPSASEGDNQSVKSSAPVVSRCFPGGYNVKLYISRGRLAWWLLTFLHSDNIYQKDSLLTKQMGLQKWWWESVCPFGSTENQRTRCLGFDSRIVLGRAYIILPLCNDTRNNCWRRLTSQFFHA